MGGYPPGTSAGDPRAPWNDEDHSHEHRWKGEEDPMIEDGAAIFHMYCTYEEGRYGDGWQCEEIRTQRFQVAWIEDKTVTPSVFYLRSELDHFLRMAKPVLIAVEQDGEITDIDPDVNFGFVKVETDDWRVKFKADHSPQIDPRPR